MKRILSIILVGILLLSLSACGVKTDKKDTSNGTSSKSTTTTASTTTTTSKTTTSTTTTIAETDTLKNDSEESLKDKFDEKIGGSVIFSSSVRNDNTGKWRMLRYSSSANIVDCAVDYYNAYFESKDEIHFVINFATKTTTVIKSMGNILDIVVHEYVDKEEHDAKVLASGLVLKQYWVYLDTGKIEDIT